MLRGIKLHIDAVARGETVEDRLRLIAGSNRLSNEAKLRQSYFLKSFCLAAAIEPYCGDVLELGDGISIALNRARKDIEGNEWPGTRVDGFGDWNVVGLFFREKQPKPISMPLLIRNAPVFGSGPWENFLPQAKRILADVVR